MTQWTAACQAPLSMEFSRQEYWGGLTNPSPGDLPDPRIDPRSPSLQADSSLTMIISRSIHVDANGIIHSFLWLSSILLCVYIYWGFPGGSDGKESACNAGDSGSTPWVGKIPWKRKWQPTPVFLPGEFHG